MNCRFIYDIKMKDDDLFINQSTVLQPDIKPRIYE